MSHFNQNSNASTNLNTTI